jgi:hypothetical protein
MIISPYIAYPDTEWLSITSDLVAQFPIPPEYLVSVVESAWNDIYSSSFGNSELQIGRDIFLPAQATGVILERLIGRRLSEIYPDWRCGEEKCEKDIVCKSNGLYSFEIKTSSSRSGIYGNRSTGHRSDNRTKYRTGYYLVINYKLPTDDDPSKLIWGIRFGWIDDEDWVGQAKPTGQQASIGSKIASKKLIYLKRTS